MEESPLASKTEYVLIVQNEGSQGQYLQHLGGEWGPDSLPTDDLLKATRFETVEAAKRYAAESNGWRCVPAAVKVSVTLKPVGRSFAF
jgi:hypothetical protein